MADEDRTEYKRQPCKNGWFFAGVCEVAPLSKNWKDTLFRETGKKTTNSLQLTWRPK